MPNPLRARRRGGQGPRRRDDRCARFGVMSAPPPPAPRQPARAGRQDGSGRGSAAPRLQMRQRRRRVSQAAPQRGTELDAARCVPGTSGRRARQPRREVRSGMQGQPKSRRDQPAPGGAGTAAPAPSQQKQARRAPRGAPAHWQLRQDIARLVDTVLVNPLVGRVAGDLLALLDDVAACGALRRKPRLHCAGRGAAAINAMRLKPR